MTGFGGRIIESNYLINLISTRTAIMQIVLFYLPPAIQSTQSTPHQCHHQHRHAYIEEPVETRSVLISSLDLLPITGNYIFSINQWSAISLYGRQTTLR